MNASDVDLSSDDDTFTIDEMTPPPWKPKANVSAIAYGRFRIHWEFAENAVGDGEFDINFRLCDGPVELYTALAYQVYELRLKRCRGKSWLETVNNIRMRCLEDRDKHNRCRHPSTVTLELGDYEPMAVEKIANTIQMWQTSFAEMAPRKEIVVFVDFHLHKDSLLDKLLENLSAQHDCCDVHFRLDCGSTYKAHGVMLAAKSSPSLLPSRKHSPQHFTTCTVILSLRSSSKYLVTWSSCKQCATSPKNSRLKICSRTAPNYSWAC